jgi:hypothetical protein
MAARNAVLIVSVPDKWRPASLNGLPPKISGGEFLIRRATLLAARAAARKFNRHYAEHPGAWALCVLSSAQRGVLRGDVASAGKAVRA